MLVWPKDEKTRKILRHPQGSSRGGYDSWLAFPSEGPADWPNDQFTARRIADGDVLTEDPNKKVAKPVIAPPKIEG